MALPCWAPRGEFVRGWQPLRLLIWALRPKTREFVRGWQPLRPLIWALRESMALPCSAPREFVRGWQPLRPLIWALRPKPRVTFPSRGKSPKARQGLRPWTRWCRVTALFALAYASRRAGFCHRTRPICHFEMVGESVLLFPLALTKKNILLLIRGSAGFWLHVWVQLLGGFGV